MRECIRCHTEMVEGCDLKVQGAGYGIIWPTVKRYLPIGLESQKLPSAPNVGRFLFILIMWIC